MKDANLMLVLLSISGFMLMFAICMVWNAVQRNRRLIDITLNLLRFEIQARAKEDYEQMKEKIKEEVKDLCFIMRYWHLLYA